MLGRKWGRIVNVTAKAAVAPSQLIGGNAYTSSKAALDAHTLNLSAELADTGVTANAFRPGIVDTAIHYWIWNTSGTDRRGTAKPVHQVPRTAC